jgi:diketogulonate reductase-like aldo/keto reductase
LGSTSRQAGLAWLLQRSPNILIIASTSSVEHLHDNVKAVSLALPADIVAALDRIAAGGIFVYLTVVAAKSTVNPSVIRGLGVSSS